MPTRYDIIVAGAPSPILCVAMEGFEIRPVERGRLLMTGTLADQAALHGVLNRVRDLGVPLLAVHRVTSTGAPDGCAAQRTEQS